MLRNYRRLLLVIIAVQPKLRKGRNRKKYGVFRERSKGERFSMIIERRENVRGTMNGIHLRILDFGHASGEQDWEGNSISPSYTRLYYICAGDGFLTANGETMPLEQGNCYLLPAGFARTAAFLPSSTGSSVPFDARKMRKLVSGRMDVRKTQAIPFPKADPLPAA